MNRYDILLKKTSPPPRIYTATNLYPMSDRNGRIYHGYAMGGAIGARVYVGNGDIPIGTVSDIDYSSNQIQIPMGSSTSGSSYFSGGASVGGGGDGGVSGSSIINSEGITIWDVTK